MICLIIISGKKRLDITINITKDPLNALAFHKRARCYHAWNHSVANALNDNYANCLRDINSALQIDRLNPTYWYFRAYFYFNKEEYNRSIHDLSNALELNPINQICSPAYWIFMSLEAVHILY